MAHFEHSSVLPQDPAKVFAMYSDFAILEKIMPEGFKIILTSPQPKLQIGAEVDMKISRFGIYMPMQLVIEDFKKGELLKVRQSVGPFVYWIHTKKFEKHGQGCLLKEIIDYDVPYGIFGKLFEDIYLARELSNIFEHRHQRINELIGVSDPTKPL